jgi:hypothetical protein
VPIGLKGNSDGSGAIQIGGSDAISISTGLNTTFAGTITASGGVMYPLTSGTAIASTSGTAIDFTGIPSWVKRITIMFQGVSTNGSAFVFIQLGTGATPTYTTSGYLGAVNSANSITNQTAGFGVIGQPAAANIVHGVSTLNNVTGNNWCYAGTAYLSNTGLGGGGAGSVSLAAPLTAVRITTSNGTDTFDAGSINILFE